MQKENHNNKHKCSFTMQETQENDIEFEENIEETYPDDPYFCILLDGTFVRPKN